MLTSSTRRLEVFKAVVDLGGLNAAAQHMDIAQPSVGAHLKALEEEVGEVLLQRRRGTRPTLTEAGRVMYELAKHIIERDELAAMRLAGLKARQSSQIRFAAQRDLALDYLPGRLSAFAGMSPHAHVVTHIGTIEDVLGLVRNGAVQVGVLLSAGSMRGMNAEVIGRMRLEVVSASDHPLAAASDITPLDLAQYRFIMGLKGSIYHRIVQRALKGIGLDDCQIALELQESSAIKQALRYGKSLACLPGCTIREEVKAGALSALRLRKDLQTLQIYCVYSSPPTKAVRRLIDTLRYAE